MIQLGDRWGLTADEYCVTVHKIRLNKETGRVYATPTYYYNNFQQALDGIVNRELQSVNPLTLETICDRIEELKELIFEIAPELPKPSVKIEDLV